MVRSEPGRLRRGLDRTADPVMLLGEIENLAKVRFVPASLNTQALQGVLAP